MNTTELTQRAAKNVSGILSQSITYDPATQKALVVFDSQNELTQIITDAYRIALPDAQFVDFDALGNVDIIACFEQMNPHDLVVLIQTGSFRLDEFRIRIHLFNKKLKVIEHLHLYRNEPATWQSYVDSLEYDKEWYATMGYGLQKTLAGAVDFHIVTHGDAGEKATVSVTGGLEIPKLNIGDYSAMENIGGTFPIGEVFTEAKTLENLNGSFWVYAFADRRFEIMMPDVFRVDITDGQVSGWSDNAPAEFCEVIKVITEQERAIVREIGFGLNRAIKRENPLGDITAYERVVGMHMSLGEKHSVYKKVGISNHKARFHVDLFLQTDEVVADKKAIFKNGVYV